MSNFCLINFGCRASQADGAALKQQLITLGLQEVPEAGTSDITVLNTCTVTAAADAEVRQVIRRVHRANAKCKILVTGCYAQRAPEEIAQLPGVEWVVGNSHKHKISELLGPRLSPSLPAGEGTGLGNIEPLVQIQPSRERGDSTPISHPAGNGEVFRLARIFAGEIPGEFHFQPVFPDDRTRPTLKIQDGCNARCAFCVIPFVRGQSRSLEPAQAIRQIRDLEEAGYQEVVLSGINLGSYGRDLDRRIDFLGLLEKILAETSLPRIRISSIEPMDVSPRLIALAAAEPRMAKHFHVPLQSGSNRILRLMNRRYWTSQYAERILAIQEQIPNCGIGADVMVGFPGETDRDHAESIRFIKSLPFAYLHVFSYSSRPQTQAASLADPIDPCRIRERGQEIRTAILKKRREFLDAQVGRSLSVLTLHETAQGSRLAVSSNYLKVAIPQPELPGNILLDVTVARFHEDFLFGFARAAESASCQDVVSEALQRQGS